MRTEPFAAPEHGKPVAANSTDIEAPADPSSSTSSHPATSYSLVMAGRILVLGNGLALGLTGGIWNSWRLAEAASNCDV